VAIGRRVVLSARFVLSGDSAIKDGCDYDAYRESCFDIEKLEFKADEKPTIFHIKPLTVEQRMHMHGVPSAIDGAWFALRCGLEKVDNYLLQDASGNDSALPPIVHQSKGDLGRLVSLDWLEQAAFPTDQWIEVAGAISRISEASRPLS